MKKIIALILFTNLSMAHSVSEGDMEGAWVLVEKSFNNHQVFENGPTPIKIYSQGRFFVSWNSEDGKAGFNEGSYKVSNGKVLEEIENSSINSDIGNKISYAPNFMGDKLSFYQEIQWVSPDGQEFVMFERWESVSCAEKECAKVRRFEN
jgi:hypothetical protein